MYNYRLQAALLLLNLLKRVKKKYIFYSPYWRIIFRMANVTVSKQICIAYSHMNTLLSENLLHKELGKHPGGRGLTVVEWL